MKHQIKHRFTDAVLFECELPDDTPSGLVTRHALEKAVSSGANLYGANLDGASLDGANLYRANLDGARLVNANLYRANLDGASLVNASLDGANLYRASLVGARLDGANLYGANLDGASLVGARLDGARIDGARLTGKRPIFMIGPIGSRCAYFTSYNTEKGIMLRAGCFWGAVDEFTEKLSKEHQDNDHAKEYLAALELIKCHASIWK